MERVSLDLYPGRMKANIRNIMKRLPEGTKTCVVIKADAYGLGASLVGPAVEELADFFAVATAGEALGLRNAGIRKPILVLGFTAPEEWEALIRAGVRLCVFRKEDALAIAALAETRGLKALVHFKIDTGMNQIGFEPDQETVAMIASLSDLPGLEAEGLFSHFFNADIRDQRFIREQYSRFCFVKNGLEKLGKRPPVCHIANSAASMVFPEASEDMVRLGIAFYGLDPSEEMEHPVKLLPVAELRSQVILVKTLEPGESVGYGGTFTAQSPCRIATVPIGYADGYSRLLSGKGSVLIRGKKAPIRGNICMDQMMVEVTDIPDVREGDTVTLIGRDGDNEIRLTELAAAGGILHYEFQCGFSALRGARRLVNTEE